MLDRKSVLERYGLPDRPVFEIEPYRDDHGLWRIKVGYEGAPTILLSLGLMQKLADEIRHLDGELAEQIDGAVELARRYSTSG